MNAEDIGLPPHLQRMVNAGVSGLDIMHGELKNLMLIAEQDLESNPESINVIDIPGQIEATRHLLSVATDIMNNSNERVYG